MSTVDGWTERAAALRDELVAADKLTSPEWQAALLAVPRHEFVPQFYQRGTEPGPGNWELLSESSPDTRERWWNGVWANNSLVTQLGPVGRWGRQVVTGPSSSSSAPSLMTRMLEALDIRDGNRVLEIGTGTGYNAALMSHRLGDQNVFSIDVDAELVDCARDRLGSMGYRPTLATVDGVNGLPRHAPYDRIIATCAVSRVPWCWAEQITEGGLILVDVKPSAAVGNLVLLRREHNRLEGRFNSGCATFMHMRTPAFHTEPQPRPQRNRADAQRRMTTLRTERLWENAPLCSSCTSGKVDEWRPATRWTRRPVLPAPCSFPARTAHGVSCPPRARTGLAKSGKVAPAGCGQTLRRRRSCGVNWGSPDGAVLASQSCPMSNKWYGSTSQPVKIAGLCR